MDLRPPSSTRQQVRVACSLSNSCMLPASMRPVPAGCYQSKPDSRPSGLKDRLGRRPAPGGRLPKPPDEPRRVIDSPAPVAALGQNG